MASSVLSLSLNDAVPGPHSVDETAINEHGAVGGFIN
jgi:hypothetical protein